MPRRNAQLLPMSRRVTKSYDRNFSTLRDAEASRDVKTVPLLRRRSNLNPFAARWVSAAKELGIDRMKLFGEGSLRRAFTEVEIFYNQERPHQGIGNKTILVYKEEMVGRGVIDCRSRVGGLLNYYHREAA